MKETHRPSRLEAQATILPPPPLPARTSRPWLIAILSLAAFASAHSEVVLLGASADASIFQNNISNSNGAGPGLFVGTNSNKSPRRTLISFDLSLIPAGSIINDVQLTLTLGQIAGSGGNASDVSAFARTFSLYELSQGWGEGSTGSTATAIGGTGQGFSAGTGDATWSSAKYGVTTWNTPGGDFDPLASGSLTIQTGVTAGNAFTWGSTTEMVADVQGWLDAPSTNHGWILLNGDETGTQTFFAFYSSEWTNAAQTPVLAVTYTVPEPATWLLFGAGFLLMNCRRLRRRVQS